MILKLIKYSNNFVSIKMIRDMSVFLYGIDHLTVENVLAIEIGNLKTELTEIAKENIQSLSCSC